MTFTTIPTSGAKFRASDLAALITEVRPVSAYKTADTTRANDATRTADPHLTIALPANSTWDWDLSLIINSVANAAGDFTGEMAFPASATLSYGSLSLVDTIASGQSADLKAEGASVDSTSPSDSFDIGCSTVETHALITGRIVLGATAGSLTLNWGQLVSNANGTTLQNGCRLVAHRVA